MAVGRTAPLQNPNRSAPTDPITYGIIPRSAPLPFQTLTPSPNECNTTTNQFCVPRATMTMVDPPVGIIKCLIL